MLASPKIGTFALPIILKFTEYKIPMTKIPESRFDILICTCSIPVNKPTVNPPTSAIMDPTVGDMPFFKVTAIMAPPKVKLPSADKSGKSNIL